LRPFRRGFIARAAPDRSGILDAAILVTGLGDMMPILFVSVGRHTPQHCAGTSSGLIAESSQGE
jgi:hypothetical protein